MANRELTIVPDERPVTLGLAKESLYFKQNSMFSFHRRAKV
jgi:hypothetical protein